jgi:hypothetical protein
MSPRRSDSRRVASQRYRLGKCEFTDRGSERPRCHNVNANSKQLRELFRKTENREQFFADGTGVRKLHQEVDVAAGRGLAARHRTEYADVARATVR